MVEVVTTIDVEDIKRLSLGPDDVLFIKTKKLSREQVDHLRTCMRSLFPSGKVAFVDTDIEDMFVINA